MRTFVRSIGLMGLKYKKEAFGSLSAPPVYPGLRQRTYSPEKAESVSRVAQVV
jgi:hypothetical protein